MEKKFEILNYDELPKCSIAGKKVVNWMSVKEGFIFNTYHEYYGYHEFKLIKYVKNKQRLYMIYGDNCYDITTNDFCKGKIGRLLGERTKEFKYKIGQTFKDEKRDLITTDRKYIKKELKPDEKGRVYTLNEKWYKHKCNRCGWTEGWIEERHLKAGNGCSCCSGRTVVSHINSIWATDKWMCDLGVSEEDAKSYAYGSKKIITVICPDCGKDKKCRINSIYNTKTIGCSCGDGTSYPEKFIFSTLMQLSIEFLTQYSPEYLKREENGKVSQKRSDFYIPSLKLVIEVDGGMNHKGGKVHRHSKKTLEEHIEIDNWKDKQYELHGIETIRINCFKSNTEYIKNSILKSKLKDILDLIKIDWLKCEEFALKNVVKEVCDYWNNKEEWETTKDLGSVFKLHGTTVSNYLKKGVKLGWCNYDTKDEVRKSSSKNGKSLAKQVEIFKDSISLGIFESCLELERRSEELFGVKLLFGNISAVCRGIRNSYKGFTFEYV